jgi:hypothetical protein
MIRHAANFFAAAIVLWVPGRASGGMLAVPSPFEPSTGANNAAERADDSCPELRGIMATPDGPRFCLFDRARKSSEWVAVNEHFGAFQVMSADIAADSVTVASEGRMKILRLLPDRVIPAPDDSPPPAAAEPTPPWTMTRRMPGEPRAPTASPGSSSPGSLP